MLRTCLCSPELKDAVHRHEHWLLNSLFALQGQKSGAQAQGKRPTVATSVSAAEGVGEVGKWRGNQRYLFGEASEIFTLAGALGSLGSPASS